MFRERRGRDGRDSQSTGTRVNEVEMQRIRVVDSHTYEMTLKFPSGAYLPAMASPFNCIYAD